MGAAGSLWLSAGLPVVALAASDRPAGEPRRGRACGDVRPVPGRLADDQLNSIHVVNALFEWSLPSIPFRARGGSAAGLKPPPQWLHPLQHTPTMLGLGADCLGGSCTMPIHR